MINNIGTTSDASSANSNQWIMLLLLMLLLLGGESNSDCGSSGLGLGNGILGGQLGSMLPLILIFLALTGGFNT